MSKLSDEIGGFATIPNTVIKMIPEIGADAFTLWSYLRYRTNGESGVAFPSYETIREDLGPEFHARNVATCLKTLMRYELVDRKRRFGKSTEYTLKCPPPPQKEQAFSPFNGERQVLSTVKDKSFQRVKTNKIDFNKTDHNQTAAATAKALGTKSVTPDIFSLYEGLGLTLNEIIRDELCEAEKEYPAAWIPEAFKRAAAANVRRWNYVKRILDSWKEAGEMDSPRMKAAYAMPARPRDSSPYHTRTD